MSGRRALDGIRVLELGQVMAGPFCALQLCDMGADVIKVEPPDGDPTRQMGARAGTDSACFAAMNRGKRGIVIDLKSAAGRDALVRLAARADIFVENFRPGVMRQLGLDYPALSAVNGRLIYASISGYGQTGPDRGKGGFDLVAQGASGLMSVTGEPGGSPVKVGVPLTDLGAGLFALAAILAALHYRGQSGRGQYIDTSLLEAGLALSAWESAELFAGGAPQAMGSAHRFLAPYQAIRCADGYVTIGAGTDRLFAGLAALLGHPEWTAVPEFADTSLRVRNRASLAALIEGVTRRSRRRTGWRRSRPTASRADRSTPTPRLSPIRTSSHGRWSWRSIIRRLVRCGRSAPRSRCPRRRPASSAARRCSASTPRRSCGRSGSTRKRSGGS